MRLLDNIRAKLREFRYHVPTSLVYDCRLVNGGGHSVTARPEHPLLVRGLSISVSPASTRAMRWLRRWDPARAGWIRMTLHGDEVFFSPMALMCIAGSHVLPFIRRMVVKPDSDLRVECFAEGPLACLANIIADWRVCVYLSCDAIQLFTWRHLTLFRADKPRARSKKERRRR